MWSHLLWPTLQKRKPWFEILKCIAQTNMKGKSRCRPLCCICYYCNCTASAVLWCCCCFTLIIQVSFVFGLRRFTTVIPVVPNVTHKIYVRKTTVVLEKKLELFSEHIHTFLLHYIGRTISCLLGLQVRIQQQNAFYSYHICWKKKAYIAHFPEI